ncbi:DUF3800 domain-containing protein [Micromonospora aurantiaca (nom. illeg.)]|uniref:DUF3800 domain-containing protein n=1 Tax=Micromonospora aurantiaca (nom. illeg.) TaxID=47850 RepID=UPI0036B09E2A
MLLTYVDESYTDRWYWIGALLVPEAVAIPLSTALDEVMTDAAKAYGIDRAAELHGYDLFQGRMAWARVPPRARIAVYNAALKAIGTYDVTVILRGVDRHGLTRRYGLTRPAHEVVLSHLLERVDGYAAMRDELALVIADEVDNPASHRSGLTRYRVDGTGGYRSRRLSRIVDTLHFAPSHASRLGAGRRPGHLPVPQDGERGGRGSSGGDDEHAAVVLGRAAPIPLVVLASDRAADARRARLKAGPKAVAGTLTGLLRTPG